MSRAPRVTMDKRAGISVIVECCQLKRLEALRLAGLESSDLVAGELDLTSTRCAFAQRRVRALAIMSTVGAEDEIPEAIDDPHNDGARDTCEPGPAARCRSTRSPWLSNASGGGGWLSSWLQSID